MRAHETRLYSAVYGEHMAELKPVIQPSGSDSAALDNVFEILTTAEALAADGEVPADPRRLGRPRRHAAARSATCSAIATR